MLLFTLSLSLNMVLANQDKVELYQQKRQEYLSKEVQNRNILSEIYEMQKSLRKINQEKNKLFTNKKNIDDQIAKLEPVVNKANKNISDQRIKIQKRLQYIYKFQDMGLLKVLFTAQAPSELDRNLRILKNITEEDYQNLKRYFKNVKTLRIKQNELNNKKEVVLAMEKQIVLKEKQLKEFLVG